MQSTIGTVFGIETFRVVAYNRFMMIRHHNGCGRHEEKSFHNCTITSG